MTGDRSQSFEASCLGKLAYPTKGAALERMRRLKARGGRIPKADKAKKRTPYRCGHCDQWHMGSEG